jgi:hypothetical protein
MALKDRSEIGRKQFRSGRVLQIVIAVLLSAGAMNNILKTSDALRNAALLGFGEASLFPLALVLLLSTLLYVLPRTASLGAVILTGWLGGAVATHVIYSGGLLVMCMPVVFGVLIWLALWLQDSFLRSNNKDLGSGEQEIKQLDFRHIAIELRFIKPISGVCQLQNQFETLSPTRTRYICTFHACARYPVNLPAYLIGRRFIRKAQQRTVENVRDILEEGAST